MYFTHTTATLSVAQVSVFKDPSDPLNFSPFADTFKAPITHQLHASDKRQPIFRVYMASVGGPRLLSCLRAGEYPDDA